MEIRQKKWTNHLTKTYIYYKYSHFDVVVPVEYFHGFTLQAQECEAIPTDGNEPSEEDLRQEVGILTTMAPATLLPLLHRPLDQRHLVGRGGDEAPLLLRGLHHLSVHPQAVHLVQQPGARALLRRLLHLHRVAQAQRPQEQLLPLLRTQSKRPLQPDYQILSVIYTQLLVQTINSSWSSDKSQHLLSLMTCYHHVCSSRAVCKALSRLL